MYINRRGISLLLVYVISLSSALGLHVLIQLLQDVQQLPGAEERWSLLVVAAVDPFRQS